MGEALGRARRTRAKTEMCRQDITLEKGIREELILHNGIKTVVVEGGEHSNQGMKEDPPCHFRGSFSKRVTTQDVVAAGHDGNRPLPRGGRGTKGALS